MPGVAIFAVLGLLLRFDIAQRPVPLFTLKVKRLNVLEIRFRTPLLRKSFESFRLASQKYGEAVARKYIQRITLIKQAKNLNEIMAMHGLRCHALRGDRKGQYAITLDYRYRLIFTLSRNEIEVVWIEEVSKHYDD